MLTEMTRKKKGSRLKKILEKRGSLRHFMIVSEVLAYRELNHFHPREKKFERDAK